MFEQLTAEIDAALQQGETPSWPAQLGPRHPPRGWQRWLARVPIGFYRAGLGGWLGRRFLMLTHTGRKSGRPRQVVLEVVRYDQETKTVVVVSGFGPQSDWFRNIRLRPEVRVHIGGEDFAARAEQLSLEAAVQEFKDYGRRHPWAFRALTLVLKYPWDGTEAGYLALAQRLPVVRLQRLDSTSDYSV